MKKIANNRIQIREALKTKEGKKLLALAKVSKGAKMDKKQLFILYARMKQIAKEIGSK